MIPPVPYCIRLPLAFAFISTAITIRVSADLVSDGLGAVARWIVPELKERTR